MSDLKEQLAEAEKEFGKDSFVVQQIHNQIAAKGTSAQELWLTGSVPRQTNNGDHTTTTQGATKKE